ncbi:hypothetical protein SAMN04489712_105143 [Thermomonospora echinospora]|uniref:Uncharacterized protein n=1 Tax=Thermomonospora echinospora TaxID=1992 RepID=A0A1H6A286_9ACTN|nr:hypothetical protein [Thermomonospora echinospora]SEG42520.1 hypothetical protein SAMN04489712_105143 [Thermomonospora echinospora]
MSGSGKRGKTADTVGRQIVIWSIVLGVIGLIVVLVVADNNDDEVGFSGGGLFGSEGAGRLVERLNAAAGAQQICYGWEIDSDLPGMTDYITPVTPSAPALRTPAPGATPLPTPAPGTPQSETEQRLRDTLAAEPGVDVGSNLGTGVDPRERPQECPRWVVFTADYYYDITEEEWTSVTQGIETNLPLQLSPSDLRQAGITEVDLLGDQANARLADAVGALPMIVAEKGAAPPVPQIDVQAPPAGDKISPPGMARYVWMGIGGVLVAGGLVWIVIAAVRSRRSA